MNDETISLRHFSHSSSNAYTPGQIVCFTRDLRTSKQWFRLPAAAEADSTLQSPVVDLLDDGVPTLGSPSTFGRLTLHYLMVCINRVRHQMPNVSYAMDCFGLLHSLPSHR